MQKAILNGTMLTSIYVASASLMEFCAGAIFWSLALPLGTDNLFGLKKRAFALECAMDMYMVFRLPFYTFEQTNQVLFIDRSKPFFTITLAVFPVLVNVQIYEVQTTKNKSIIYELLHTGRVLPEYKNAPRTKRTLAPSQNAEKHSHAHHDIDQFLKHQW